MLPPVRVATKIFSPLKPAPRVLPALSIMAGSLLLAFDLSIKVLIGFNKVDWPINGLPLAAKITKTIIL